MHFVLKALRPGNKIAIQSANGVGKTELVAGITLWFLDCFEQHKVLTTGSSWTSLEDVLWPRIHKIRSAVGLWPLNKTSSMEIALGVEYGRAFARSPNKPENMAGVHAPRLLQIVEEASGVDEDIAVAIDGNDTGEKGMQVWIGNPIRPNGPFYERCTKNLKYIVFKISALDHPNVITGRDIIPGAVSRKSVEEKARDWCAWVDRDTPGALHLPWMDDNDGWIVPDARFQARVLGEFPTSADDVLIPLHLLQAATRRPLPEPSQSEHIATGVDIARFGSDDTVIADLCDGGVFHVERFHGKRTTETAGRIRNRYHDRARSVAVDDGGVGGGVSDNLEENAVPHLEVNFGSSADDPSTYVNLKAQMYWEFKIELENNENFYIPDDPALIEEASSIKFYYDSKGRIAIESKDQYRRRTGRSPDTLEAVLLGLYALKRGEAGSGLGAAIFGRTKRIGSTPLD